MSTSKYPNRDALREANDIYLDAMRPFIIHHLKQVPGVTVEDLVEETLTDNQADEFWRKLDDTDDIKSAIDFSYFPLIIRDHWQRVFAQWFNRDRFVQNMVWLIKDGRNSCEHRGTEDLDDGFTRMHLCLIAELLSKINQPDKKLEVEDIRDELFSQDLKEHLAEVEAENAKYQKSLVEIEKHLETAKAETTEYEKDNATLSNQIDEKEKRLKKLSKQLKSARTANDKYKRNLSGTKQRLEKSEVAQADYKERLKTTSKELKDTKNELAAVETEKTDHKKHLKTISKELESVKVGKSASEEYLAVTQNVLTTVAIGDQAIFPPLDTNAAARILDRRGTDKRNYLLGLLEQKQPTIIYVQSEEMVNKLLTLVGSEKADVIGRHHEQTSDAEETKILKKLESGELIAVVSNTAFSTLTPLCCVEHFVFCHLPPSSDAFFDRCQPAFTSEKDTYLHLIYNSEQDMEGLVQKYPDREVLKKMYPKLKKLTETNGNLIKIENLYSKLDIAKLGIETGLAIFEELQLLERNEVGIKLLPPVGKKLDESKTYHRGESLKKEAANFRAFQLEHSIEQIWEGILETLNVDSEQILRESDIHKMPLRISETEGDYLKNSQTQSEQSTEVVEIDNAASDETLEASPTPNPRVLMRK